MKLTIEQEVLEAVEAKRGKKESNDQAYCERIIRLCDKVLTDATWEILSEEAQSWVTDGIKALANGKKIKPFPVTDAAKKAEVADGDEDDGGVSEPLADDAEGTDVELPLEDEDDADAAEGGEEESEESMATKAKATTKAKAQPKKTPTPATKADAKKPAAKAAEPKAKAPAKKAAAPKKGALAPDAKIKLLAKENPKREGSIAHKKFAKLKNGMTVKEAGDVGYKALDLKYDVDHGYISIG